MSRPCLVCVSPNRDGVDAALVGGIAADEIARRYPPLSATSIRRHRAEHIPAAIAQAQAAAEMTRGDALLGEVNKLKAKAISLLLAAERAGDIRTALAGIREARACLELLLEVEGEINRTPVVNLTLSVEWQQTRAIILRALMDYPEAKQAVVGALSASAGVSA